MNTTPKVSVGWASILGWVGSAAGVVAAMSEGLDTAHGLKYAIISGVLLLGTNAGRMLQAHGLAKAGADVEAGAHIAEAVIPAVAPREAPPVAESGK